jgi:hypothetical protein
VPQRWESGFNWVRYKAKIIFTSSFLFPADTVLKEVLLGIWLLVRSKRKWQSNIKDWFLIVGMCGEMELARDLTERLALILAEMNPQTWHCSKLVVKPANNTNVEKFNVCTQSRKKGKIKKEVVSRRTAHFLSVVIYVCMCVYVFMYVCTYLSKYTVWTKSAQPNLQKVSLHHNARKKYFTKIDLQKLGLRVMASWASARDVVVWTVTACLSGKFWV